MAAVYRLDPAFRIALRELGIPAAHVLRRAGLPLDLLGREAPTVSADGYYAFWAALGDEAGDPAVGLELGQIAATEVFSPPILAALASPNLTAATERVAQFKPLLAPIAFQQHADEDGLILRFSGIGHPLPPILALTELSFFVSFARRATRTRVVPLQVTLPERLTDATPVEDELGVRLRVGDEVRIMFSATDAERPFLTADASAWAFFEPILETRLADMDRGASLAVRVHSALVELLPSGRASINDVAEVLHTSARSLQRRLRDEGTSFQAVLADTRLELATHYLNRSNVATSEVALLLGYNDASSFFRAFRSWSGTTPESYRTASAIT